jgi:hypothetical protein
MFWLPTALTISNYPIVCTTMGAFFQKRYRIASCNWNMLVDKRVPEAELVILDVTSISRDAALKTLAPVLPEARVVCCSLLYDEVQVYRPGPAGFTMERDLPTLLALAP